MLNNTRRLQVRMLKNTTLNSLIINSVIMMLSINCQQIYGSASETNDKSTIIKNSPQDTSHVAQPATDQSIQKHQIELLDLAFNTATMIPVHPHIKDRSLAQQKVVEACIKLGQIKKAEMYIRKIENWRKNLCYATIAFYYAQKDQSAEAEYYIRLANVIDKDVTEWRRSRIMALIAQAYARLGMSQKATEYQAGLEEAELGKVDTAHAMIASEDSFYLQIQRLDELISKGVYDITKNALDSYAQLFNTFYNSLERRTEIETKIEQIMNDKQIRIPLFVKMDVYEKMAKLALEKGDNIKALAFINIMQTLFESAQWPTDKHVPRLAKLAELRYKAGDKEKAIKDLESAHSVYKSKGNKIVNIWRAGALRPLAQSYKIVDNSEASLLVYKKAVEEGIVNPNSRPRAEDLSATCSSMALYAVQPDEKLKKRLYEIHEELGSPW